MESSPCDGCPAGAPRRAFLRDASAAALGALAALAGVPARLLGLPVQFVSGFGPPPDKVYSLPAADGVAIDKDESVIIARFENRVYAFSLACPHQNTALRWDDGARRFQCPRHRSRYRPDGTFIEGRATRGLDRFAARRVDDRIHVNLDMLYREDEQHAQWVAAFVQL